MNGEIGAAIKEARLAAGLTQKALAEAVDGVSADGISKAERGLKQLTDEQLQAIAKATGSDLGLSSAEKDEEPAAPPVEGSGQSNAEKDEAPAAPPVEGSGQSSAEKRKAPAAPPIEGLDILNMFNAAVPAVKNAALNVLKGDKPQSKDVVADAIDKISGILRGEKGGNPLAAIIGFLGSEEGKAFMNALKDILDNFTGVFGGGEEGEGGNTTSNSFLAFTFFYTVAIYVLIIGFFFLQGRVDIKSLEQ